MLNGKRIPTCRKQAWASWSVQVRRLLLLIVLTFLLFKQSNWLQHDVVAAFEQDRASAINPGCVNLIPNGQFEQISPSWQIQSGPRPPVYSTDQAFSGGWSMQVGNGLALPNVAGISEVRHEPILLPANATSIILRFVYWPLYESAPGSDIQEADLFNATTDQFILPLFKVQDDKRAWKAVDQDLTAYAGQEISLRFRVYNDGLLGRSLMYVDNVEIEYCADAPIPTFTPSLTPATSATPVPTWTTDVTVTALPTLTPTLTPLATLPTATYQPTVIAAPDMIPTVNPACTNILMDPGFEGWGGWHFGEDPVPARYVSDIRLAGSSAVQLGNPPGQQTNVKTFSSVRQLVTIPHDAVAAELRWWKLLRTEQPGVAGPLTDRQDVVFLDPALNTLAVPRRELRNDGVWVEDRIDLMNYRGRTFYVYFNAFNEGNGARTWMYLDNVQVNVCGSMWTSAQRSTVIDTPVFASPAALPATLVATGTPIPLPTPSPLPTQSPTPTLPLPATVSPTVPLPTPTVTPTEIVLAQVTPTALEELSNVNPLPTATASFLLATDTPDSLPPTVADASVASGVTVEAPLVVTPVPAPDSERPIWIDRLGPISVLLGVLVLIGFIVWAIVRTFRTEHG